MPSILPAPNSDSHCSRLNVYLTLCEFILHGGFCLSCPISFLLSLDVKQRNDNESTHNRHYRGKPIKANVKYIGALSLRPEELC
jgi:hypothetical protein